MRLIDADALEKILTDAITIQEGMAAALGIENDEGVQMELKAYRDILNGVKEQPTINPQEPVKPVLKGQIYYCSGCNCYGLGIKRDGFGYKFCPGCGRPVNWNDKQEND